MLTVLPVSSTAVYSTVQNIEEFVEFPGYHTVCHPTVVSFSFPRHHPPARLPPSYPYALPTPCRHELDLLPDPQEAHRRRGAHWTFDGRRFLREVGDARRTGGGMFPGFDHAGGDPVESQWEVMVR